MMIIPNKKRVLTFAMVYSFLLSFFIVFGFSFYQSNQFQDFFQTPEIIVKNILAIIVLTSIISFFSYSIFSIDFRIEIHSNGKYRKYYFPLLVLYYFIVRLPAFFAYFPGIWSYDIGTQIFQILSGEYNTYHPPLQTFFLELCIRIANFDYVKALTIYAIIQMILLSCVFAYFTCFLIKRNTPVWFIIICMIFWGLNPVISIFSIIPVKDVICGIVLILLTMSLADLSFNAEYCLRSPKEFIKFCSLCVLFCLFRNNAIYAVIVALPFYLLFEDKNRGRIAIFLLSPIFLFFVIVKVVYPFLGIESATGSEIISVPLQQIANVVSNSPETLSSNDIEIINQFLPYEDIAKLYNPRFADPIRFVYDGSNGLIFVIKEWLKLLPTHLSEYINAFLALNTPLWNPVASAADPLSGAIYIETNVTYHNVGAPFLNYGLAPDLLLFYERIADYSLLEKIPKLLNPFSLSFALWFMLFCFFKLLSVENISKATFFIIPFLFWATYLLCPVSSMRYIIPIVLIYPLFGYYSFFKQ